MAITPTAPQTMPIVALPAVQRAQFIQGSSRLQLALDDGVMGWTGIPIIYVQEKKKKKVAPGSRRMPTFERKKRLRR